MKFLVGDNPFHGISHLSQERSRARDDAMKRVDHNAQLVTTSLTNGANGFMFSVSETTLSILSAIRREKEVNDICLYAIVPYAYEYVRLATQSGGMSGLATHLARILCSRETSRQLQSGQKALFKWTFNRF